MDKGKEPKSQKADTREDKRNKDEGMHDTQQQGMKRNVNTPHSTDPCCDIKKIHRGG